MIFSFLGLALVDRYIYPVCPACAPGHDHHACRTRLHGFGIPLISAAVLHSFLDGWGIGATEQHQAFGLAIFAGIAFHKVPEALAFGIILRAALPRPATAMAWAGLVQFSMVAGGWAGFGMAPMLGVYWLHVLLGVAGGTFLYLGLHAVHGEWRRRGMPAFGPALTGAAGAAALQHGLRVLFR
ncbi:MAG: ZIP family metal transporter [Bryobacteraceae bacterium]